MNKIAFSKQRLPCQRWLTVLISTPPLPLTSVTLTYPAWSTRCLQSGCNPRNELHNTICTKLVYCNPLHNLYHVPCNVCQKCPNNKSVNSKIQRSPIYEQNNAKLTKINYTRDLIIILYYLITTNALKCLTKWRQPFVKNGLKEFNFFVQKLKFCTFHTIWFKFLQYIVQIRIK